MLHSNELTRWNRYVRDRVSFEQQQPAARDVVERDTSNEMNTFK